VLVESKIPAYRGTKAQNNRLVLGYFSRKGSSLPYDAFKDMRNEGHYKKNQYPTVYRRIKDLVEKGYLIEAGERSTKRGKRTEEIQYGISWIGLVASLAIEDIRRKILDVFELNLNSLDFEIRQNTGIYLNALFPSMRKIIETIYSQAQIETIVSLVFKAYLESSTPSLDNLKGASGLGNLMWTMQVAQATMSEIEELPEGERIPAMRIIELFDDPSILQIAQSLLPPTSERFKEGLENQYRFLVHIPGEIGLLLQGLKSEDKPSLKVKEFLENELSRSSFSLEVKE
jgi:DNA-binding PadR family transcriptional regulator